MKVSRGLVKVASGIFPNYFVNKAYETLVNPQVKKLRPHELEVLDLAEKRDIAFHSFRIRTYSWNPGHEKVLLIHGWEGQAGNFADLIELLVRAGYTVEAFDAPSHGFSSQGETSLIEFKDLAGFMIRKSGAKKLVSHSFGGVATTGALFDNLDITIDAYALLTTPDKFAERLDQVADQTGISNGVKKRLKSTIERELGMKAESLNVSDWVREIGVRRAAIWHGKTDTVIPIAQSRNVALNWSEAEMNEIPEVGHFRILRSPEILEQVITFLGKS